MQIIADSIEVVSDYGEFCQRLQEDVLGVWKDCLISTYGLYAGVGKNKADKYYEWQGHFLYQLLSLLDSGEGRRVQVAVGLSELFHCTPNCPHCQKQYKRRIENLALTRAKFKNIEFLFVRENHTKFIAFDSGVVYAGSRNLSGSSWKEMSLRMVSVPLYQVCVDLYKNIRGCSTALTGRGRL